MYVSDSSFRWKSLPTADHSGWKSKDKAVYWSNRRHRRRRLQLGQAAIGKHFLVDFTITSLGSLTDTGKFNRLRCRHFTADHIKTYLWLHFSRSDLCKEASILTVLCGGTVSFLIILYWFVMDEVQYQFFVMMIILIHLFLVFN